MTDVDHADALNALVPSRRMLRARKRYFWTAMKDAIQNRKLRKLAYKPEDIPAVTSALDTELMSVPWVPASPRNTQIGDPKAVDKKLYNGSTAWDFMTTDIDLSNSTTCIFDELEMYCSSFNPQLNSQGL
ncbi:hypothetical protein F5146DRAFT_1145086 [Armillaria mellea]|nr:hypothetical protein F5146DRAFT_1145086 [Armillaria mellea]